MRTILYSNVIIDSFCFLLFSPLLFVWFFFNWPKIKEWKKVFEIPNGYHGFYIRHRLLLLFMFCVFALITIYMLDIRIPIISLQMEQQPKTTTKFIVIKKFLGKKKNCNTQNVPIDESTTTLNQEKQIQMKPWYIWAYLIIIIYCMV